MSNFSYNSLYHFLYNPNNKRWSFQCSFFNQKVISYLQGKEISSLPIIEKMSYFDQCIFLKRSSFISIQKEKQNFWVKEIPSGNIIFQGIFFERTTFPSTLNTKCCFWCREYDLSKNFSSIWGSFYFYGGAEKYFR